MEKKSSIIMAAAVLCLVLFPGTLAAQSGAVLDIVTEEWEDCTVADGTGLYFDILRAVFEPEGIKLSIKILPYARSIDTVTGKKADAVIGPYEDEVSGVLYPKWQIDSDNVSALYLKSRFPDFSGASSLDGKNVAWMRGYGYEEYFEQRMNITEVDKRENALNLLLKNRIDFYLDAQADIEAALEDFKTDGSRLVLTPIKYMKIFVCFADTAEGKKYAGIWDRNFKKLLDSGKIRDLYRKWDMANAYRF